MKRLFMVVFVVVIFFSVKNADAVINYSSDAIISSTIQDASDIIIGPNVTLTMTGDVSFIAGGIFTMDPTSTINVGGYALSIAAGSSSTLGNINNANLFTLNSISSSNVTFTSNSTSTFQVNMAKTNYHAILSRSVGTGTSSDPIMIYSVSDAPGGLQYIPTSGLGLCYKLANNIDASETSNWNSGAGFVPIGTISSSFAGTFNGDNKTISGLYVNTPSTTNIVGLFGLVDVSFTISNVGILNVNMTGGSSPTSGLVGANCGSIQNCYSVNGTISGSGYTGGLVGTNIGSITNSYSTGTIAGTGSSNICTGGLVGRNWNGLGLFGSITNSYSTANVSGNNWNIGGLVGQNNSFITSSYSTGSVSVSGIGNCVGGLVGLNNSANGSSGSIANCYSTSNITGNVTGMSCIGGLVGLNQSSITNSYSTGNVVTGVNSCSIGGLGGSNTGSIANSYSTGTVSGSSDIGGFIGSNSGSISNCGWWTGASTYPIGTGGTITYNESERKAFYNPSLGIYTAGTSKWDFVNTWDSFTVTYPHLHWECYIAPLYLPFVAADLDGIGLDDLVVDFGPDYGIWARYDSGTWSQVHSLSPDFMVKGNLDGDANRKDDLVIDFGDTLGIWICYNDNESWAQLHNISPKYMATADIDLNGLDEVVIDFGSDYGIWVYYPETANWTQLHSLSSEGIIVPADENGEYILCIDFGNTYGIWNWHPDTITWPDTWTQLHPLSPKHGIAADLDNDGWDEEILDFGEGYGIWIYESNGGYWTQLHTLSSESIVTGNIDGGGDDLVIDFGDAYGIWARYDNGSWAQIHNLNPEWIVTGDLDGSGDDIIIDFGDTYGIWARYEDSSWEQLHNLSP